MHIVKPNIRMRKKCDFDCEKVGVNQGGFVSWKTWEELRDNTSKTTNSWVTVLWAVLFNARGRRRIVRPFWTDRKQVVTKITPHYKTTIQILEECLYMHNMSDFEMHGRRRPLRVLHLSSKNGKPRLQWTQNLTAKHRNKHVWGEFISFVPHADEEVRVCHK